MTPSLHRLITGLALSLMGVPMLSAQTTINVGAVAASTNTGFFLNANGSFATNGEILVGTFSKSQAELAAIIAGWDNSLPTYDHYAALAAYFTAVGTGATNYGSTPAGWTFATNGTISGTSAGISTNILSFGSQLYVWTFGGTTNQTMDGISVNNQWALVTATNWTAPASGTASLVLSGVSASGVLIGTDLSGTSSLNSNSVAMFTQRSLAWTNVAGNSAWNTSSSNWTYSGSGATFQNGDLVTFGGNASGVITVHSNGVKPGGMTFSITNSLTLTGGNIDGSANLTVNGIGTLTIASTNSFKGQTVISSGGLSLGTSGSLTSTANISVGAAGTLLLGNSNQVAHDVPMTLGGGTISLGAAPIVRASSVSIGTLTLTANSVLDFSSLGGSSSFTVASIKGLTGSSVLSIYNYDGSGGLTHFFDADGPTNLSSSMLSSILFYSGPGSGLLGTGGFSGNEIIPVPVPEPGVMFAMILMMGITLIPQLRKQILAARAG